MGTQLKQLNDEAGQSIWLDNIRRSMFKSGELHRLIEAGLRGMTSNPTIFEKAIGSGNDYDEQLGSLIKSEQDPNHLFEALAIDDIRHACDEFRPLYDSTNGFDGFVSLEVSPLLANDTQGTIDAAARLWKMVDRPNVMIKIPSTPPCLPSITATIAAGINVNVTLIFSLETYEAVANAYIAGIEQRAAKGLPLDRVASVASVFVSRIDTAVDKLLEERIDKGQTQLRDLLGKTGVANLKLIYARFQKIFEDERFKALAGKGAHVQRPLWASTGTKNPAYSDLLYVENLVGRHTVNTVPPATLDALLDHGVVRPDTVEDDLAGAHATIDALAKAQISLYDVTQKLQVEGVKSFADSYNAMLEAIEGKRKQLASGDERVAIRLGKTEAGPEAAIARLAQDDFLAKLWKLDPSPWSADDSHAEIIKRALGWLEFPRTVCENAPDLAAFAAQSAKLFSHVVVLGMGGSSLAPDTLRATFGKIPNYPELHVLDSSDPDQIKTLERSLDLARTMFVVASKSGTTIEPEAFFRYFFDRVAKIVGADNAGQQFIAITDPETGLAREAEDAGFRRIFLNDPNTGGRYSALTYFGMVPAALAGYDIESILESGLGILESNSRTTKVASAPAVRFGAAIATLAKAGRDKLTIVCHPGIAAFGAWAEQLIAESTGKNNTGIVPIDGEPLGTPAEYGSDRVFVYVGAGLPAAAGDTDAATIETRLAAIEEAGHPIIRLSMADKTEIGAQFALWEIATATAGAVLNIDAFDQPNVQESKDNTKRLLAEFKQRGTFPEPEAAQTNDTARIILLSGSAKLALGSDLSSAFAAILDQARPGDYIAFNAYIERSSANEAALRGIRLKVRDALKLATTVGFGPRFLHSTGQLHKGGPNTGIFFEFTKDVDPKEDLAIPGMPSFGTLLRAQALGDFESLDKRDRRGARIHLTVPLAQALEAIEAAVEDAVAAKV